jgi:Spy/CpxP family protein refolding chaperone
MTRRTRFAILAAAVLLLPLTMAAQTPPADAPEAQQAPGPWMGRGPGFGPGPDGPMGGGQWMGQGPRGRGQGFGEGRGNFRGRGMRGGMGFGRGIGRGLGLGILERDAALRERLNVTEQQLERLRTLRSEHQKSQIRQQAELRVRQLELAEQLRGESPDRALVERLMRETNEMRFAQQKAAMDHMFAARDVFTAEQRAEMRKAMEERMTQMRQRRFEQRGPGIGPQGPRGPRGPAPAPQPPQPPPTE